MPGDLFGGVRSYIVSIAGVSAAVTLIPTIYFTQDELHWLPLLTGVLIASVLAEAARASRSEWVMMRRTAQLSSMKKKYEQELQYRKCNEPLFAELYMRSRLLDDTLSVAIVLIDTNGYCRYHNRTFRLWFNLKEGLVDERHIRILIGSRAYAKISTAISQSLDGQFLHYEYVHDQTGHVVSRMMVEHAPQFDSQGRVKGLYLIATDITKRADPIVCDDVRENRLNPPARMNEWVEKAGEICHVEDRVDAGKSFIEAVQAGEFRLYCQLISPLPLDSGKTAHYAILLRLMEEEGTMAPPGEFFQLAEKSGLMPYMDRWVVQQVLRWAARQGVGRDHDSMYFINVSGSTLGDPEFPVFLQNLLYEMRVPGAILCFEVSDAELRVRSHSVIEFIRQVRRCGCGVALSGFGREDASFDFIRGFQVEFLKIDGGVILNMISDPAEFAKVVSINRVAKKIGVKTVAELVESEEIVAKLCEVGIDFSQGAGISQPRRLTE